MSTFLLLHGAGATGWFWHRVAEVLERTGNAAICPDLPADDPDAGLGEYVDRAMETLRDRTPEPAVVVGQSMSGLIAPVIASMQPTRQLILVAPMIPQQGERGGEWWDTTGQADAQRRHFDELGLDHADLMNPEVLFGHDVPSDLWAESGRRQRQQSTRPFADPFPLSSWPEVATRVVAPADDRLFPLEFQREVSRQRLGIDVEVVPGGHLAALSHPDPLAHLLLSALDA